MHTVKHYAPYVITVLALVILSHLSFVAIAHIAHFVIMHTGSTVLASIVFVPSVYVAVKAVTFMTREVRHLCLDLFRTGV